VTTGVVRQARRPRTAAAEEEEEGRGGGVKHSCGTEGVGQREAEVRAYASGIARPRSRACKRGKRQLSSAARHFRRVCEGKPAMATAAREEELSESSGERKRKKAAS